MMEEWLQQSTSPLFDTAALFSVINFATHTFLEWSRTEVFLSFVTVFSLVSAFHVYWNYIAAWSSYTQDQDMNADDGRNTNNNNNNIFVDEDTSSMDRTGTLQLILGCMFSGKSTELIRQAKTYRSVNERVLLINHGTDRVRTRGQSVVKTHDRSSLDCIMVERLSEVPQGLLRDHHVIAIDEGQFFADLVPMVRIWVEEFGLHVIVSGLDGSFKREPLGTMLELIPMATNYEKLHAKCTECRDARGRPVDASFTTMVVDPAGARISTEGFCVGGSEKYRPVCRDCFKRLNTNVKIA